MGATNPLLALRLLKILRGDSSPEIEYNSSIIDPDTRGPDEELENIRRLYQEEPAGVKTYRDFVANAPDRRNFSPSVGRRILSILAGAGEELATKDPGRGLAVAEDISTEPYRRAVEQYKLKGEGLGKLAALDEKRQESKIRGEGAVENIKTRRSIDEGNRAAKQAALDEKIREANLRHEEALQRAKDQAARDKASDDYKQEMLEFRKQAQKDNLDFRKQAHEENIELRKDLATPLKIDDPNNPGETISVDRITGKVLGNAPLPAGTQEIIHAADAVKEATSRIRTNIPKVIKKIGPIAGNWEEIKQKLGVSKDSDARQLVVDMDNLTKSHAKIFGSRAGVQMFEQLAKSFKNINQDPKAFAATLKAIDDQADDFKKVRTPHGGKKKISPFTVTPVNE